MTAVVLSSETPEETQAFYAKRLNLAPPEPAAAEPPKGAEPAVESESEKKPEPAKADAEGESIDEQQIPNPEARQKVHFRFSELTQQKKAAEAKAAEAAAKAEAEAKARVVAEQEAAALRAKYEPPKTDPLGPKPARAQFANDDEFATALEEWTTDKVNREHETAQRNAAAAKVWTERQTAAKAEIADYDAAIAAAAEFVVSNEVRDAIIESEQGPWILHHLAKNPSTVADLAKMSKEGALRLIGKLEGRFEVERASKKPAAEPPKAAAKPAAVAAVETPRAPAHAPITPLRTSSPVATEVAVDANGEFHGTAAQWREARKKGLIR